MSRGEPLLERRRSRSPPRPGCPGRPRWRPRRCRGASSGRSAQVTISTPGGGSTVGRLDRGQVELEPRTRGRSPRSRGAARRRGSLGSSSRPRLERRVRPRSRAQPRSPRAARSRHRGRGAPPGRGRATRRCGGVCRRSTRAPRRRRARRRARRRSQTHRRATAIASRRGLGDATRLVRVDGVVRSPPEPRGLVRLGSPDLQHRGYNRAHNIRGRPGFDVVGSPAELQAEVPGRPR